MLKIANLKLGIFPCIALTVSDRENIKAIGRLGVDLLEIRLDCFRRLDENYVIAKIQYYKELDRPLILTIRDKNEGGKRFISDKLKFSLYALAIKLVDAVDIELNSKMLSGVLRLARKNKKTTIISFHDFKSVPPERMLEELLKKAKSHRGDIFKIACMARTPEDMLRLALFTLRKKREGIISILLGIRGSKSRVVFPALGSLISYTHLSRSFAPGQIPVKELIKELRLCYGKYKL